MTQTWAGTIPTRLPADGWMLACSDGLTDAEPSSVLAQILDHQDGQAALELWKAAIEASGPDNITSPWSGLPNWTSRLYPRMNEELSPRSLHHRTHPLTPRIAGFWVGWEWWRVRR